MNEKALALFAFFMSLLVFFHLKLVFRLRKRKMNQEVLQGVLFIEDILEGVACCIDCGLQARDMDKKKEEEDEKYRLGKLPDEPTVSIKARRKRAEVSIRDLSEMQQAF